MKYQLRFHTEALKQLEQWRSSDPAVFKRIGNLLKAISESPFTGIGKPEALSGKLERILVSENYKERQAHLPSS